VSALQATEIASNGGYQLIFDEKCDAEIMWRIDRDIKQC
jgi:hypothetical protein